MPNKNDPNKLGQMAAQMMAALSSYQPSDVMPGSMYDDGVPYDGPHSNPEMNPYLNPRIYEGLDLPILRPTQPSPEQVFPDFDYGKLMQSLQSLRRIDKPTPSAMVSPEQYMQIIGAMMQAASEPSKTPYPKPKSK